MLLDAYPPRCSINSMYSLIRNCTQLRHTENTGGCYGDGSCSCAIKSGLQRECVRSARSFRSGNECHCSRFSEHPRSHSAMRSQDRNNVQSTLYYLCSAYMLSLYSVLHAREKLLSPSQDSNSVQPSTRICHKYHVCTVRIDKKHMQHKVHRSFVGHTLGYQGEGPGTEREASAGAAKNLSGGKRNVSVLECPGGREVETEKQV